MNVSASSAWRGKFTSPRACSWQILGLALAVIAAPQAGAQSPPVRRPLKIVLVGDSTVATEGGWGPGFCKLFAPAVTCIDLALNGRSSKSFLDEGAWKKALAEQADVYLIQFGHNDQKPDPERHTNPGPTPPSFAAFLTRYVSDARSLGSTPVLVTSLSRRTFRDGHVLEDLKPYADATRQLAAEQHLALIDLNLLSTALLNRMTQQQADAFDASAHADAAAENQGSAKLDRTHLNAHGQDVFGRIVAEELLRLDPQLTPYLKPEPAARPPSD